MFSPLPQSFTHGALRFIILCALVATASCSRYRQTKQCRALIAQVNPALDDVTSLTHGGAATTGGAYTAAAGRYERLAKQLGPLEFASEDMAQFVAEYVGLLNSSAENLRAMAKALDTSNASEADRSNRELERITAHERSIVARMDAWCRP